MMDIPFRYSKLKYTFSLRFQKFRFATMFEKYEEKRKARESKGKRPRTPDYFHIDNLKTKRGHTYHGM